MQKTIKQPEREIRCGQCGRLLLKGEVVDIAIKCPRCKTINRITSGKLPQDVATP